MLKTKITGLDELQKNLKKLQDNIKSVDGQHSIPLKELFDPAFMQQNTTHSSIEAMFEVSGYTVESVEDFEKIPSDDWDKFVQTTTNFNSWQNMQEEAAKCYLIKKIEFGL